MTSKLEKQFFDTFGIEPKNRFKGCKLGAKYYSEICDEPTCNGCDDEIRETEYPQITDRILLELICIVLNVFETFEVNRIMDVDSLKEKILKLSMLAKDDVYSQVRTLFAEG